MTERANPFAAPETRRLRAASTEVRPGAGQRFAAACIDATVQLAAVCAGFAAVVGGAMVLPKTGVGVTEVGLILALLAIPVVLLGYGAALEASQWQATVGKRLVGLMVVDVDGRPVGLAVSIWRNLAKVFLLNLCSGLFALTVFVDVSLWDVVAGTQVVVGAPTAEGKVGPVEPASPVVIAAIIGGFVGVSLLAIVVMGAIG